MARVVGSTDRPFAQLVMSGGGLRCLWQGGFLDVVREPLAITPKRVIGVSGGALSAAGFLAHCGNYVLDRFLDLAHSTDENIRFGQTHQNGLTPHQSAYRRVVSDCLTQARQETIARAPHFQVFMGRPPSARWPKLTGSLATCLYQLELHTVASPHFRWPGMFGVEGMHIDARAAAERGDLADLVCAAAVIPPIFEPPLWDGAPVIDGGMVDQAPMPSPDDGQTLVLLNRHYRGLKSHPRRTYVAPSKDVPVNKIDFTDAEAMRQTWEQGRRDGERYLA